MFALRFKDTKEFVGFTASSNSDAIFACSVCFELERSSSSDNVWVTTERAAAEFTANHSVEWYNANFNTPMNGFVGQLEVVELSEMNRSQ